MEKAQFSILVSMFIGQNTVKRSLEALFSVVRRMTSARLCLPSLGLRPNARSRACSFDWSSKPCSASRRRFACLPASGHGGRVPFQSLFSMSFPLFVCAHASSFATAPRGRAIRRGRLTAALRLPYRPGASLRMKSSFIVHTNQLALRYNFCTFPGPNNYKHAGLSEENL